MVLNASTAGGDRRGYVIKRADIPAFAGRLAAIGDVYCPVYEDGIPVWGWVGTAGGELDADRVAWDFPRTVTSPKEVFFPHTWRFMAFHRKAGEYDVRRLDPPRPSVVLGAKPCDMAAVDMLRQVMTGGEFPDESFEERRRSITAVAVACEQPEASCACGAFELSPGSTRGADLVLYPAGELVYAVAITPAGERAVAAAGSLFSSASSESVESVASGYRARSVEPRSGSGRVLTAEKVRAAVDAMAREFHLPYWAEVSERCLSCGICAYVCPTCYCFAMVDLLRGDAGARSRCWDTCMYPGFSRMAGGHNPRAGKAERVRQRFMHKLVYHAERYGEALCVGCGRCVDRCPVGLHVACVVDDLAAACAGGGAVHGS